jgi:hypothetical protein
MVYTTGNSTVRNFPQELDMPVASKLSQDRLTDKLLIWFQLLPAQRDNAPSSADDRWTLSS